ncbi:MAG: glucose-1-phosphate adenylyltransferase [Ectothiorhodospiraceae bacterium]|nr:glucose-1-phosphate adenylyltransferase [Chromatiales bacterium]MCP5156435.1 glucose-1-phosphate adenylyltransferase [Ectothiorhodospiraceae bacterium]
MGEQHDPGLINRVTRGTLALVLAGGQGTRLHELTEWRAKPAVPFGGKFRIIDFVLSNCVNSGVRRIGVITQYKAHSLIRHLVRGWSNFRDELGEFMQVLPASQRVGGAWYQGTADAVYQNLDIIRAQRPGYVLVLGGDHVYKMDYTPMLLGHIEREADCTVACIEVPVEEAAGTYGVAVVDAEDRIIGFEEKPANPTPVPGRPGICLASMGNYAFNTRFLYERLIADADDPRSTKDFGRDLIPHCVSRYRVHAHRFQGRGGGTYWRDVGTLDSYWKANMELVSVVPPLNLYDHEWPILTDQAQLPPAKFVFDDDDGRRGEAIDSMVSGGCIISGGSLRRSLLFSNVRVNEYARVEDTVVLPDVSIGPRCDIHRAILDRGCVIEAGTVIGRDREADKARNFRVTDDGVTLVTPDMLGQALHHHR